MLNKEIIHEHRVAFEENAREGKRHLEYMEKSAADEIFHEAKSNGMAKFKADSTGEHYELVYQGAEDGYGHYLVARLGYASSPSWF